MATTRCFYIVQNGKMFSSRKAFFLLSTWGQIFKTNFKAKYIYIYIQLRKKLFSIIYRRKGFRPLFYTSVHCVLIHVDSKNLTKWFHNIICGVWNVDTIMLLIWTQNFQFSIYMFVKNLIRKHSNCILHVFVYLD